MKRDVADLEEKERTLKGGIAHQGEGKTGGKRIQDGESYRGLYYNKTTTAAADNNVNSG